MSYTVVRQEGFQLPSPTHTTSSASPSNTPTSPTSNLFMPPNLSFLPDSFRKFPSAAQAHSQPPPTIDFTDDLATLIDPHPSQERSTYDPDPYRHNIFDISAPASHYRPPSSADIYQNSNDLPVHNFNSTLPALNSSLRYEPHPDPSHFAYRHTPSPHNPNSRSRSRSRPPSLGPTRTSRRDRRANSISSHVSGTSPPPPPARPHSIVIPGRGGGSTMGGFFVPGQTEYSLPTPDSLTHSFGGFQGYNAATPAYAPQPASYASQNNVNVNYGSFGARTGTPSMGISPSEVSTLGMLASSPTSAPPTAKGKHTDGDGLSEKRRRRRESHNAVERRRRDNINERIGELAGLIPGVLFECDAPLIPPTSPTSANATSPGENSGDLFSLSLLPDASTPEEGLPDVPEDGVPPANGNTVKKDPSEDGDDARSANNINASGGVNGGIPTNGVTTANGSEPQMIKANKGMILRKSVEYIRYLQQLVSVQASRGRELEERNRALERELAAIQGTPMPLPMPASRSASNSTSDSSPFSESSRLSLASSQTSLPQSQSSWESERKWEMDVEERAGDHDEERGRGRARARKEDVGGVKDREGGVVGGVGVDDDEGEDSSSRERDMET
ncbi:hypothetical protein AZE42_10481 [Rhizopogon vesiculosus]|uniref:BHLH domain-containing protein n=1 Tax=Rhizopogon vesiculosus TaxID=180088 RepID=A0A1J8Q5K7_9AGAM|nr:hypothetical protein AZE42_10481 [Rhizopogon vesiculosus]